MTIDACKAIVGEYALPIAQVLGLGSWSLSFEYDSDCGNYGSVIVSADHHCAEINIDPEVHGSKAEVLNTILHELVHVVNYPLERFREYVFEHTKGATCEILDTIGLSASEQLVTAWMGILNQCLGLTPAKLARKAQ